MSRADFAFVVVLVVALVFMVAAHWYRARLRVLASWSWWEITTHLFQPGDPHPETCSVCTRPAKEHARGLVVEEAYSCGRCLEPTRTFTTYAAATSRVVVNLDSARYCPACRAAVLREEAAL